MILLPFVLLGQVEIAKEGEQCQCKIQTELQDSSLLTVSGIFEQTGQLDFAVLNYELRIKRILNNGSTSQQVQSGTFHPQEGISKTLSQVTLNIDPGTQINVDLFVFDSTKQVCFDQYPGNPIGNQNQNGNQNTQGIPRQLNQIIDANNSTQDAELDLEIGDLIIDRTVSKIGHDFYDLFYKTFQAPPGITQYMIEVEELPSRGLGSRIRMKVNDRELTNLNVTPRGDYMEEMAQQTVAMVQGYLVNYKAIMKQLEGADQKGTGIY
jgi:curli production assembly/transport component CsgE